ncbi:MAG: ATP-binding protein [Dorea sp.]|nr:ATP-binding protein [Dorea sp.]
MKKELGKTIFYSFIIILAAQLSMNLFIADFKISLAIVCLPLFLFLIDSFQLFPVTFCTAAGVYISRTLIYWFQNGSLKGTVRSYLPETLFYISYGLLLFLYKKLLKDHALERTHAVFPLILIDYFANLTELLVRLGMNAFHLKTQSSILLIAILRTMIVWCILTAIEQYRLFLLDREHEERYRRLLLLISKLNGEVVWMRKNTTLIEDTMSTAYKLYEQLKGSCLNPELTSSALKVARDIHEIKKEYLLIMRGISETLDEELTSDGMYLKDLLELLKDAISLIAREQKLELRMEIHCTDNPYTNQHYALMSIFRNLFINALEAADTPSVFLQVTQISREESFIFTVTDHGPGIDPEYIDEVFKTGFSTKINYTTGEINRGLGLNLVQDLVENQFHGRIELSSHPGLTTFTITIPLKYLKGDLK